MINKPKKIKNIFEKIIENLIPKEAKNIMKLLLNQLVIVNKEYIMTIKYLEKEIEYLYATDSIQWRAIQDSWCD